MNKLFGIEVEICGMSRRGFRQIMESTGMRGTFRFESHDDGSIRNETYAAAGIYVQPMYTKRGQIIPSGSVPVERVGTELVTPPLDLDTARLYMQFIQKFLGHLNSNSRSSIHIHMDASERPWTWIQNLVKWFYYLEAPLYRLARMGDLYHRGVLDYDDPRRGISNNDHRFARPLSCPIAMMGYGSEFVPAINIQALLNAQTCSEMFAHYGRMDRLWRNAPHYSPQRLHGLNLLPLMTHKTVELRIFNGNLKHTGTALEIANGLYNLADVPVPDDFKAMPLGSTPNGFTLKDISRILDVSPELLRPLWKVEAAREWVAGCSYTLLPHHYNDVQLLMPITKSPIVKVFNFSNEEDDGSPLFSPTSSTRAPILRTTRDDEDDDDEDDSDDSDDIGDNTDATIDDDNVIVQFLSDFTDASNIATTSTTTFTNIDTPIQTRYVPTNTLSQDLREGITSSWLDDLLERRSRGENV